MKIKLKICAVCGTRPDTVKMAPVINELKKHQDKAEVVLIVTGQHREMLEQVIKVFNLNPDYDLDIMTAKQSLASITTKALEKLDVILEKEEPDILLAQGDTTTTFVASLSAFYRKIPFGHVEAGLRTNNKFDPFPEEINRRITGILADVHFAPTQLAKENLLNENISENDIFVTGNTVIDALLTTASQDYKFSNPIYDEIKKYEKIILLTTHRRENWGDKMQQICLAVDEIIKTNKDIAVVFPVHKNPIVRETVLPILQNKERIFLIEPPDYIEFVHLMKLSNIVLTDSGGVQEEAPSLGKPVLVLRETTERPEGVDAGNAKLIGTNKQNIIDQTNNLLNNIEEYDKMAKANNPYGDGNSSKKICNIIFDRYYKK
ncbi:MAG: UDP-N-acetylglucosamine 2-epimerase (non-hydrolyzing) [Armatimonadota bacterium]